jgi:hypothetical protein
MPGISTTMLLTKIAIVTMVAAGAMAFASAAEAYTYHHRHYRHPVYRTHVPNTVPSTRNPATIRYRNDRQLSGRTG